jgi:hypothetical protein
MDANGRASIRVALNGGRASNYFFFLGFFVSFLPLSMLFAMADSPFLSDYSCSRRAAIMP